MGKWKMVRLGDIGTIVTGSTPPKNEAIFYDSDDIPFFKPNDFSENTIEKLTIPNEYVSEKARKKIRLLPVGSVLVTCIGTIGKVGIATCESTCNQQINAIIPHDKVITSEYLANVVLTRRAYLKQIANAPVVPIINKRNFSEVLIPLPPLDEQKRIAKNLDLASEIVKGYKEQLAELDKLVQSVFYEMFGDPVTNEKGWKLSKLSALGELNRGISKHRPRNAPELLGGKYPLIQTGEVSNSGLYITKYTNTYSDVGLKQSRLWNAGTLCITIAANIAQTAILAFDACFPDSVVGFISGNLTNQIFIHTWFGFFQRILEEQAPQVAQKNINLRILGNLDVIVPPLSLQTTFASIVTEIEAQKAQIQQALTEAENLFNSLMQEYFE